jgi:hypothetical protein
LNHSKADKKSCCKIWKKWLSKQWLTKNVMDINRKIQTLM